LFGIFVVAVIALVLFLGVPLGTLTYADLFSNELGDYYVCNINQNIQEFKGGISGTGYSGYPFVDSRIGAVYCGSSLNKGNWIRISEYANSLGIDPYELISQDKKSDIPSPLFGTKRWVCNLESLGGCVAQ
jgi:hypothetical protein